MVKCPECDIDLVKIGEIEYKCFLCGYIFKNDLELKTGVAYMRSTCSMGMDSHNYPEDL